MLTDRRHIQIEGGDCDAAGTVFSRRYFEYGDACTNALFAKAGLFKPVMLKTHKIIGLPIVDLRARFIVPSDFGDEVVYETSVTEWGRSSFLVQHKVYRPDGALGLEIFEKRVWVRRVSEDPVKFQSEPIPEEVKRRFANAAPATGSRPAPISPRPRSQRMAPERTKWLRANESIQTLLILCANQKHRTPVPECLLASPSAGRRVEPPRGLRPCPVPH